MLETSTQAGDDPKLYPGHSAKHIVLEIVTHFESLIARGEIKAGDKIATERELASTYGISRTTVREAMYELELKGLVERVRRRGTIVTDSGNRGLMSEALLSGLSREGRQIAEILDFRAAIEPAIAARAARYATEAEIRTLEEILGKMATPGPAEEHLALNTQFHEQIAIATHNVLFVDVAKEISKSLNVLMRAQLAMSSERRTQLLVEGHSEFVDAIRERDPERSFQVALKHVEDVQTQVSSSLLAKRA
ncbi:FadR/GntR family transcriptional regulator [Streptomyces sp. TP-A0874]|uniref:FadR/GntR family transcriptional regulator n=1 Tax=Streptomyces sp. TP-A0874 TaxID=549819 RepID=UPI001481334B|nr:FCD domain-containing protein [Streptomyces sp. TP-A0874]